MRRGKVSVLSAVLMALVIGLSVSAIGFLSNGFKNWDTKKWFEDKDIPEVVGVDNTGEEIQSGKVYNLGTQMTLLSSGFSDVTLQASVYPAGASTVVDWSVKWSNAGSEWATGKTVTDFLTITPTEDGARTAVLSCIEAFGEQIIITVSSRENPAAQGNCTVDFMRRLNENILVNCELLTDGVWTPSTFSLQSATSALTLSAFANVTAIKIIGIDYAKMISDGNFVGTKQEQYVFTMASSGSSDHASLFGLQAHEIMFTTTLLNDSVPVGLGTYNRTYSGLNVNQRNTLASSSISGTSVLSTLTFTFAGEYSFSVTSIEYRLTPSSGFEFMPMSVILDQDSITI